MAFVVCSLPRFTAAAERLYVENSDSGDVSVIDIPGHTVINTIHVGKHPDDVTLSHAGDVLYVNRTESLGIPGQPRLGESGEIIAISTRTNEILWRVLVDGMPHHMTVSADDRYVFVPLFDSFFVVVVDTQKREVVERIPVGYGPHGTRLSPDKSRLYVGTMFADHIAIVDAISFRPRRFITFDDAVRPFDITSDEKRMYVQLSRYHGFVVVDLPSGEVIEKVDLPPLPPNTQMPRFFPHTVNHGLALSADNKTLYCAASIAGYVAIFSVPEHKLLATVPVGREPNWIGFSHDGKFCYVSNRKSDTVSVISTAERREITQIPVGQYPQRLRTLVLPEPSEN